MKLAFDFSYDVFVSHREGICVYNSFVFQSLLENYPDVSIDIFTNEINIPELKTGMKTYFDRFQNRIRFITRQQRILKWYEIPWNKYLFYTLKQNFYSLLSVVLKKRKEKYKQKSGRVRDKKKKFLIKTIKSLADLASESKSDIVFSDTVSLKLGHYFKCPKVFMLHDLFTIPLADLFRETYPHIDNINQYAVENLKEYANEGTYFVTSGKYIRDEQLLKYVTNLTPDRTTIIPFPPMVRDFKPDQLISENEFRDKFKINGAYIPYASQNRPNKNVILLLNALKRLKDKGIEISIVTTGNFYETKKCADFIHQNKLEKSIFQIGTVPENDLYALYKYSSLVVVPTIIEGMGMSGQALEALSVGNIPVIHTISWGIKESLELNGLSLESADLNWTALDDDKGLADKIEDILANPEPHIEKQKHIIDAYTKRTWKDVSHDYMQIFRKLIQERG